MFKKRKGITLLEILIVLPFLVVIIGVSYKIIEFSFNMSRHTTQEFAVQTSLRSASQVVDYTIKNATAIFLIPETSFEESKFSEGWNYFGIEHGTEGGESISKVVSYVYNNSTKKFDKTVLTQSMRGVTYRINFSKTENYDINKLVKFNIEAYYKDREHIVIETVDSEIEGLNTLQIVDWSSDANKSVGFAYRNDDRGLKYVGNVAVVLDASGSMASEMYTGSPTNPYETRTALLRRAATKLVEYLSQNESIELAVYSFDDYAKAICEFKNLKDNIGYFLNLFDVNNYGKPPEEDALYMYYGLTNTGDGLRLAYHGLKEQEKKIVDSGCVYKNFLVLLIDGDSNVVTATGGGNDENASLYYGDLKSRAGGTYGPWDYYGASGYGKYTGEEYANSVAEKLFADTNIAKVYFIVFANNVSSNAITSLKNSLNTDNIFLATDSFKLNAAFEDIGQDIIRDMWHVNGPELK